MSKLMGELKRMARRVAKSYGHELGAWEDYSCWDCEDEYYAECTCGAMVGVHRAQDDQGTPYASIGADIVKRCDHANPD